jgi:hypothetical protein
MQSYRSTCRFFTLAPGKKILTSPMSFDLIWVHGGGVWGFCVQTHRNPETLAGTTTADREDAKQAATAG